MTHPTDDSLKPCPFCGGAASLHPRTCDKNTPYNPADRAFPVARCGQCGAEAVGKDWGRPETAAEKWNARALLAEQARTEPVPLSDCGQLMEAIRGTAALLFGQGAAQQYPFATWRLLESYIDQMIAIVNAAARSAPPQPLKAEQAKDAAEDAELLDWLDSTNKRFKMGWKVGVAPAGNCSVQSVIFLGNSEPVTIRAAIRAARAAERKA